MNQPSGQTLEHVISLTRQRCRNQELQELLLLALHSPELIRARQTTAGVLMIGPSGSVTSHYTLSDHRAVKNLRSNLRRAGLSPAARKDN